MTPNISAQQQEQIARKVADYITAQRQHFLAQASSLGAQQSKVMNGFFTPEVLQAVRLVVLDKTRIQNPEFYADVQAMGFRDLPDFATMQAVTFYDTVVSNGPFSNGLLFHELVHVEQYRQLGVQRFANLYVRGFLTGGGYDGIPLEINAYELGERFERDFSAHFSVESEVKRWIDESRF